MQQQPCSSSEMQTISALLNAGGASSNQIQIPNFAPTSPPDDFLDQMLSSLPPWTDLKSDANLEENNGGFHYDGGGNGSAAAVKMMMQQQQQQQLMMQRNDVVNGFKSSNQQGGESSAQALFNGFSGGSVPAPNQMQNFDHSRQQVNNSGAAAGAGSVSNGGAAAAAGQPRQRVRARRGQATDPHSIAERLRRERIAERMRALQELVPNANKTDKASMLDEIVDYVKFLQLQVKVLSMSRLGGASAVAPLVADMSSEGDCIQTSANGTQTASTNDSLTVTENQVIRLMEDDMGTAMQYLQGKGLCLMPISLATTISAATCRNPISANLNGNHHLFDGGDGPCSPSMSVLTVQSNTMGPGGLDGSGKDAASVSKP